MEQAKEQGWKAAFQAVKQAAKGSKGSIIGRIGANKAKIVELEDILYKLTGEHVALRERVEKLEKARRPARKTAKK